MCGGRGAKKVVCVGGRVMCVGGAKEVVCVCGGRRREGPRLPREGLCVVRREITLWVWLCGMSEEGVGTI